MEKKEYLGLSTKEAIFIAVLFVAVALLYQTPVVRGGIQGLYEDAVVFSTRSAERAYEFGRTHFDASQFPHNYNIVRAQRLFEEALALDPTLPLVRHQLGRVAFLHGDYPKALWYLDEEAKLAGEPHPSTFYMRALVLGFMGSYETSALEFEKFLAIYPETWAALNDYAWVLLKAGRAEEALAAAQKGLEHMPGSPWLLNTASAALYEMGAYEESLQLGRTALAASASLSTESWLRAYPGNDPKIAPVGLSALQRSVEENVYSIEEVLVKQAIQ